MRLTGGLVPESRELQPVTFSVLRPPDYDITDESEDTTRSINM